MCVVWGSWLVPASEPEHLWAGSSQFLWALLSLSSLSQAASRSVCVLNVLFLNKTFKNTLLLTVPGRFSFSCCASKFPLGPRSNTITFREVLFCFLAFCLSFIVLWSIFVLVKRSAKWKSPESTLKGITLSHRKHSSVESSLYFRNCCASLCNSHYMNTYSYYEIFTFKALSRGFSP